MWYLVSIESLGSASLLGWCFLGDNSQDGIEAGEIQQLYFGQSLSSGKYVPNIKLFDARMSRVTTVEFVFLDVVQVGLDPGGILSRDGKSRCFLLIDSGKIGNSPRRVIVRPCKCPV